MDRCYFFGRLAGPSQWTLRVLRREARFVRVEAASPLATLKMEMHPVRGRLDSAENTLASKLTALADVWELRCRLGPPLSRALENAGSKAAGLFPLDLARRMLTVSRADWDLIRWIDAPEPERFLANLRRLGEGLALLPPPR